MPMTLVTPVFIKVQTTEQLKDAGYEVAETYMGFQDFDIVEGHSGQAVTDAWEPERPDGDGWLLVHKGFSAGRVSAGESYKLCAIWARETKTQNHVVSAEMLLYRSLEKWGFLDRPVHDDPINGGDLVEWFTTTFVPQAREILRQSPETYAVKPTD